MPAPSNAEENNVAAEIRWTKNNRAFYLGIARQTEENGPIKDDWYVYHNFELTNYDLLEIDLSSNINYAI